MTEVTAVGSVWRLTMYVLCIVMVSSGPGFLALGLMLDASVWGFIVVAAVLSLVLIPLGIALWFDVRQTVRGMRRLHQRGVAGTAEILSVTPSNHDDRVRVELSLSISAPGVEPFEALHTRDSSEHLQVGTTLETRVDPAGCFYTVV
jgi:hypothetical protein